MNFFLSKNLDPSQKFVYLHCVFHSIRFKVNKRLAVWEDSLFYFILVSPPKKSVTAKNEKGKNQSKIACKNIGSRVFSGFFLARSVHKGGISIE